MRKSPAVLTLLAVLLSTVLPVLTVRAVAAEPVNQHPVGDLDDPISRAPGKLSVSGWAADQDDPAAQLDVVFSYSAGGAADPTFWVNGADGKPVKTRANLTRSDVPAAFGAAHGFSTDLDLPAGKWLVCAWGIGVPSQSSPAVKCKRDAEVQGPAPETTITGAEMQGEAYAFHFGSDDAQSAFQCSWDEGAWEPCTSPTSRVLAIGLHSFAVRAVNRWGNADPTPARREVRIAAPPTTEFALVLKVKAVKKKGSIRVNVRPRSSAIKYKFRVQKRVKKRWKTVKRSRTAGAKEQRIINLPKGRYRVVLPDQHGLVGTTSQAVRLKR